jgi:hypothetical protein
MKKLVIIGTVVATVAVSLVVVPAATAKPTGMSPAQLHALMLRKSLSDQGLTLERGANERFAVGNPLRRGGVVPRYDGLDVASMTLERGLDERFASDNPVKAEIVGTAQPASPSVESSDFQWGDAGIGAAALLGAVALLGTCLVVFRNRSHLKTS